MYVISNFNNVVIVSPRSMISSLLYFCSPRFAFFVLSLSLFSLPFSRQSFSFHMYWPLWVCLMVHFSFTFAFFVQFHFVYLILNSVWFVNYVWLSIRWLFQGYLSIDALHTFIVRWLYLTHSQPNRTKLLLTHSNKYCCSFFFQCFSISSVRVGTQYKWFMWIFWFLS